MPFPTIARFEDRNYTGICHFDVVDVEDVVSVPPAVAGNIATAVELVEGATWSRVYLEDAGGALTELWKLMDGDQYSEARATGAIARDRLALMPYLWGMKGKRVLVVITNKNGDRLLMGSLKTPAMVRVTRRKTGDGEQMESERNDYDIEFVLSSRLPVPFYQAEVPDSTPVTCPNLCELLDEAIILGGGEEFAGVNATMNGESGYIPVTGTTNGKPSGSTTDWPSTGFAEFLWNGGAWMVSDGFSTWTSTEDTATPGEVVTWVGADPLPTVTDVMTGGGDASAVTDCLSPEQAAVLLDALGGAGGGGTVLIRNSADDTTLATVTAPDSYVLPAIRIPYVDAAGDAQYFLAYVDDIVSGELTVTEPGGGAPPVPRFTVFATNGSTVVGYRDLVSPTMSLAQSVIKYKDAANASQVTAASDTEFASGTLRPADEVPRREIKNRGGTGMGVYASVDALIADTLPNAPIPLKFAWAAGDADTYTWTATTDEAGTYTAYTDDGGSGAITYSKNGAAFASLTGTVSLAVGDTIVVRRATSTSNGWVKWA